MDPDNSMNGGMGVGPVPDASGMPAEGGVPGPVDFTTSDFATDGAGMGGLSMADSLASAQDDLTSAGLAAKPQDPNSIGLDQIGAADPTATMARPDEPLVPAAPVPGSIGSVVSGDAVPAVSPMVNPAAMAAPSAVGTEPVQPMAAGAAMTNVAAGQDAGPAANNPFLNNTAAGMANPVAGGAMVNPAAPALPTAGSLAAEPPVQAPYNPFAATNMNQTSSGSVPTALQAKTEKFSAKGDAGKKRSSHVAVILLGGLAALFAVAAVIFFILWQQEANKEPQIIYAPSEPDSGTDVTAREVTTVCTRQSGDENLTAMEGVVYAEETVHLTFVDGVVTRLVEGGNLTFGDEFQAENAMPQAQAVVDLMVAMYSGDMTSGVLQNGNILSYNVTIDPNALAESTTNPESAWATIGALRAENGQLVNGDQATLTADYQAQGYSCVAQ